MPPGIVQDTPDWGVEKACPHPKVAITLKHGHSRPLGFALTTTVRAASAARAGLRPPASLRLGRDPPARALGRRVSTQRSLAPGRAGLEGGW